MTTQSQIKANRNNAKKSTGPRTEEGKARVSKNALKHGLLARDAVMPGEDPEEFDRLFAALEADIKPSDALEFELVRQIADAQWRMRRLVRLETGLLAAALDDARRHEEVHCPQRLKPGYEGETLLLGSALLQRTKDLVHLARYDGHLSRRFHRAIQQIAELRDAREKRRQATAREEAQAAAYADPRPGRPLPHERPARNDSSQPANSIGFRASPRASTDSRGSGLGSRQNEKTAKQTQFRPTQLESISSGAVSPPSGALQSRPALALLTARDSCKFFKSGRPRLTRKSHQNMTKTAKM